MKKIFKNKKVQVSLLCVAVLIVGFLIGKCFTKKTIPVLKDGTEVIAKIDGKDFTVTDLYTELKKASGKNALTNIIDDYIASKEIKDTTDAKEYADGYIANLKSQYDYYKEDLEKALKDYGYASLDAYKEIVIKDRLKQQVAEKFIKNTDFGFISESEVKNYYKDEIKGAMTARYILIIPEAVDENAADKAAKTEENEAKALKEANEVIEKLKKGEKFEDLAKKYSDDKTTAPEGGLLSGFNAKDVVSEFWNATEALEDNKYTTEPVKSSYGYFVIKRIKQDAKPSLEDSKEECLTALYSKKAEEDKDITTKAWIKIRKSYNLDIIDTDLEKEYNSMKKEYE